MRLVALSLILVLPGITLGAGGGAGADFLDIKTSARAAAMGSAYVSLADNLSCLQWNPAGLTSVDVPIVEFDHVQYFADTKYEYLAGGLPLGTQGNLGVSYYYSGVGDLFGTNELGVSKKASMYDMVGTVGYSRKLGESFSLGLNTKYYYSYILGSTASGFAFDFGALYELLPRLRLGCSLLNIGPDIKYERVGDPLPRWTKAGLTACVLDYGNSRLLFSVEMSKALFEGVDAYYGAGTEYSLSDIFFARLGYGTRSEESGVTYGMGVGYKNIALNYAFVPYGVLGDSHNASLAYEFRGM